MDSLVKGITYLLHSDIAEITPWFTNLQILLFIICVILYLLPLLFRWVRLIANQWVVAKIVKNTKQFSDARTKIESKIFKHTKWASKCFRQFTVNWNEARLRGDDKATVPIRLKDFLTRTTLIEEAANQRIAEALPGIFTAIGIFGTFLGLYLGLRDIKIDNLSGLQQEVGQLIAGLSLAFTTSLYGICFAVLFSLSHRFLIKRVENTFQKIDSLLFRVYPCISFEQYSRKYLEVQEDLKHGMQTLATDIATKLSAVIEPAIGRAISENLVPIMQNIQKALMDHLERTDQKQAETLEHILNQYVEHMSLTFKGQINDMKEVIAETTRAQMRIKDQLITFGEQLEKQFQVQHDLIEKTTRTSQILNSSLESLGNISHELKNAADDISTAATLLENAANRVMEGQNTLKETMKEQMQAMADTREELSSAWQMISKNAQSVVYLIREVIRELGEGVGNQLTKALEVFDGKIAEVTERFSGTLFEIKETIDELPLFFQKMEDVLENLKNDIAEQKNAIIEFKKATADVIKPNFEIVAQTSEELKNSFIKFKQLSDEILENIKKTSALLSLEGSIQAAFEKIQAHLTKLHERLDERGQVFNRVGDNGNSLNELFQHMTSLMESIKELSSKMERVIDKFSNSIEKPKPTETSKTFLDKFFGR